MYNKVDTKLDFLKNEKEVLDFWKTNDIFKKTLEQTKDGEVFSFFDGPPTANGLPHIGHPLTRAMKDIIPRYKTMCGYYVPRKAGWDCHGLPVEVEVEKKIGSNGKSDIEKFGVDKFIALCKESVWKYKTMWEEMSERFGYWIDLEHPYITYDNNYIESIFWAFSELNKKGLIYKGHKIMPYCPRCGTALSKAEVEQNDCYKIVHEKSIFVKFKSLEEQNTYFLVWTTTPWTLPSNVAICMNPEEQYSKLESEGTNYIMLNSLISTLFEDGTYKIIYTKKGSEFEHQKYEPLFNYVSNDIKCGYFVTVDDYVTTEDGTGIVHIAPAFGEDDEKVGKKYNLDFIQLVDEAGKLKAEVTDFAGMFVKNADKGIIEKLQNENKMFKVISSEHSYPHCWRCNSPLLYYATSSWLLKMTNLREELVQNNNSVYWLPDNVKLGRMGNFLANNVDWCISRTRYWGTPLPFWICDDCNSMQVIGSVAELKEKGNVEGDIDLHKPTLDKITFSCPKCGGTMHRTPEVLDCWFDSGSMPFAQLHYPFENKELFEKTFPANFICEGIDQTRGWFNSLQNINTALFEKSPYKACIALGLVNDKFGKKMSKSKGNGVDPWEIMNKEGADALRWYFYSNASPGNNLNFNEDNLLELQKKFMGTLWNVYAFYILYANIDNFNPNDYNLKDCKLAFIDKWILSKYNALIKLTRESLDKLDMMEPAKKITDFVDELSNWYVRRSRERFWASGKDDDKISAFKTLYEVLSGLTKLIAPFVPFIAENIYQNLIRSTDKNAPISVHLCNYPVENDNYIDTELNNGMENVLDVVFLIRSARNVSGIKNKQPLSRAIVCSSIPLEFTPELLELVKAESNVENVEILTEAYEYVSYSIKPQLRTLGPKYGKNINAIRDYLSSLDANVALKSVKNGKTLDFVVNGENISLTEEDLFIEVHNKEGYISESNGVITAIIDTTITPELYNQMIVREIISKIQNLRKDTNYEVTDHIELNITAPQSIMDIIKNNSQTICKSTLCDNLASVFTPDNATEFDLDENLVKISIKKI